jgi:hypothetical protein
MTRPGVAQLFCRLARISLAQVSAKAPALDVDAVDEALRRHFAALELAMPPVRWLDGGVDTYVEAFQSGSQQSETWVAATRDLDRRARRAATATLLLDRDTKRFLDWKAARRSAAVVAWSLGQPAIAAADAAWRAARQQLRTAAEMAGWEGPANDHWHRARIGHSGVRRAVSDVAEAFGFVHALTVLEDAASLKLAEAWLPMVDAYLAGLFLFAVRSDAIVCVPRPRMARDSAGLHCSDGPAVEWGAREPYWFWRGVEVPSWVIDDPARITPALIRAERNQQLRHCMIERMGAERCLRETGGTLVATDSCGRLWHCPLDGQQAVVEVENGSPEPDGSRRHYFLYVPPAMQTAREAVAWTYGMAASDYEIAKRS